MFHSRVEFCGALLICGRDIKLIYRRIAQSALSIYYNILICILKLINLIEFLFVKLEQILITKLEQIFVFGGNYWTSSRVITYCIYTNPGQSPRKLVNFLMWNNVFFWKISYFGNFLYTPRPTRGSRLYQGSRAPWPHAGYGPASGAKFQLENIMQLTVVGRYLRT